MWSSLIGDPEEYFPPAAAQCVFYLFILLSVLLGHIIHRHGLKYVTEGSVALLIGLWVGGIFYLQYDWLPRWGLPALAPRVVNFDGDLFFTVLLPPIIFYAGFSVKKQLFFHQFGTLIVFGVVGTTAMAAIIAFGAYHLLAAWNMDTKGKHGEAGVPDDLLYTSLYLGAIFASTDTVAALQTVHKDKYPVLHSLVFGEGVVNDATAIVLVSATQVLARTKAAVGLGTTFQLMSTCAYLFVLSMVLGVVTGLASAAIVKHVFSHHSTNHEVLVVVLLGYVSSAAAEAADLSPILAVFFSGVTMSHYTWHSLSADAQVITRGGFAIIASLAELALFVYAGSDMWVTIAWETKDFTQAEKFARMAVVSLGLFALMLLSRAAVAFSVVWVANRSWRRHEILSVPETAVLWLSGLPRGAITLALSYKIFHEAYNKSPDNSMLVAVTVVIVLCTTVGFGAGLGPAIDYLLRRPNVMSRAPTLTDRVDADTEGAFDAAAAAAAAEEGDVRVEAEGEGEGEGGVHSPLIAPRKSGANLALSSVGRTWIHGLWRNFDARFMQPYFGGSKAPPGTRPPPMSFS